jgi:bifunctional non-homologous end joining protein LigD
VRLPPQVAPMLAVASAPFDSPQHSFEVKWDGIRVLAGVAGSAWRLWGREQSDYTTRYPELSVLRGLPVGTVVDGEVVAFDAAGRADLRRLLRRHGLVDDWRIEQAKEWCPVTYVVFDLLWLRDRSLLREPLARRREGLAELCATTALPEVVFSAAVTGAGHAFYAAAVAAGQEGVVAKHLASAYRPGRRVPAWRKIKPGRFWGNEASFPATALRYAAFCHISGTRRAGTLHTARHAVTQESQ